MRVRRIVTHVLVIGTTRSGKTFYVNRLHRRYPRRSLFVDTKGVDPLWGLRIHDLDDAAAAFQRSSKVIWDPPRTTTGIDWPNAIAQLERFWGRVQGIAKRTRRQPWPYLQVVVDEAQQWEGRYTLPNGTTRAIPPILEDMAARGLGLGLRLVYVTQYPAGLKPKTRSNLNTRIAFAPGDEAARVMQQWGWPLDVVTAATARPHAFATYLREHGWRNHAPVAA